MRKVFRRSTVLLMAVVAGLATLVVAGATAGVSKKAAGGDVCVLLPDTASSVRWEHFDKPALISAFKAAKVSYSITNADNDAQKQKTQADQCLGNGAKVLIEVMLDAGSASAIEKSAKAKGVPSIDYDRQVPGRRRVDLRLVRRRRGRRPAGQGCRRRSEGERQVLAAPGRGRAERRHDRPELVPVQGRVRLDPQAALQARRLQEGPGSVRARLGQPEGRDDLRADARQDREQDRRSRGGQRRPRERRRRRAEEPRPQADPALGPGCDAAGRAEHHLGLADDDRLEGHADPGEGRGAVGDSAPQGPEADHDRLGDERRPRRSRRSSSRRSRSTKANWRKLYTSGFLKKSDICNGSYKKYC